MIIDGVNVTEAGVIVGTRPSARSAAVTKQIVEGAPGAWRRKRLGREAPEALGINLTGAIVGDLLTGGTTAQLRANIDQFKYMIRPDKELTIRWSDQVGDSPIREWFGYRNTLTISDINPGWKTEGVRFNLSLICPDPFGRESSTSNVNGSGGLPVVLTPLIGTAPMPVIITLEGTSTPVVNPVFHYRDGANADIVTLSYTGSLGASDDLVIDTEFFTAKVNGSNVGGDISGSYFDINPGDGDKYAGSPTYPDVQVTSDSGLCQTFELDYKRRYW